MHIHDVTHLSVSGKEQTFNTAMNVVDTAGSTVVTDTIDNAPPSGIVQQILISGIHAPGNELVKQFVDIAVQHLKTEIIQANSDVFTDMTLPMGIFTKEFSKNMSKNMLGQIKAKHVAKFSAFLHYFKADADVENAIANVFYETKQTQRGLNTHGDSKKAMLQHKMRISLDNEIQKYGFKIVGWQPTTTEDQSGLHEPPIVELAIVITKL